MLTCVHRWSDYQRLEPTRDEAVADGETTTQRRPSPAPSSLLSKLRRLDNIYSDDDEDNAEQDNNAANRDSNGNARNHFGVNDDGSGGETAALFATGRTTTTTTRTQRPTTHGTVKQFPVDGSTLMNYIQRRIPYLGEFYAAAEREKRRRA